LKIRFTPVSSESLGVRSLCVYVETGDLRILLDAGVSLGQRFFTTPHPLEYEALREARARIRYYAAISDVVTISHYHFDHYTATWKNLEAKWSWSCYREAEKIYRGKTVFAKDYRSSVNHSQRQRGYIFGKIAEDFVGEVKYTDSATYSIGGTQICFTEPLPHGEENTALGYVIGLDITYNGETLSYYPDVQGPMVEYTLKRILEAKPETLIIGGPPIYLSGSKVGSEAVERGLSGLKMLVQEVPFTLLDHHIFRSEDGLEKLSILKGYAERSGHKVSTFAEYLGLENRLLEARRRRLFEEFPPTQEFRRWMNLSTLRQSLQPPPL